MNAQEQVARLEALLARVQRNALALQHERSLGTPAEQSEQPVVASDAAAVLAAPHSAPREQLSSTPVSSFAVERAPSRPVEAAAESSYPDAPTLIPTSGTIMDAGWESIPPSEEQTLEHTKPLWVGLTEIPGPHGAPLPPGSVPTTPPVAAASSTASAAESNAIFSTPLAPSAPPPRDSERVDSEPPSSGERASFRSPSYPPEDSAPALEEPLNSVPAERVVHAPNGSVVISTTSFETTPELTDRDTVARISDAPSALGATISLPDEDVGDVELELAEPPPSSLRLVAPPPAEPPPPEDDELEVDLPRTSFRAAYDDSLPSPPMARAELAAHDLNVRERLSSRPAGDNRAERSSASISPVSLPTHTEDLPPVLSVRPQPPVVRPTDVMELGAENLSMASEAEFGSPAAATDAPPAPLSAAPLAPPSVTSGITPEAVTYAPQVTGEVALFTGEYKRAKDASFLELLDGTLSLGIRP